MSDIVERLRYGTQQRSHPALVELCNEAADRIEDLRNAPNNNRDWVRSLSNENNELRAEIEHLRVDKAKLITLLAQTRGPEGETEERIAEWLRGRGYTCVRAALEPKP